MKNVKLLEDFANKKKVVPRFMTLGFAVYILFMKCELSSDGTYVGDCGYGLYKINDEQPAVIP